MVNGQWSMVNVVLDVSSLINVVPVCSSARPLNPGRLEVSADNVGTNNDLVRTGGAMIELWSGTACRDL